MVLGSEHRALRLHTPDALHGGSCAQRTWAEHQKGLSTVLFYHLVTCHAAAMQGSVLLLQEQ